ncbi:MAG: phage terminase large subunit [Xanthomonadales bacterium]|nr:phage terminase large subunit [Xanthomonadales bacterium]
MGKTARIELPPKLVPVFASKRGSLQYRGAYGGRGSGKSFSFAKMAAIWGYAEPLRVLCTREYQVSIKESFHAELKAAIASEPWLDSFYDVGVDYLRGPNGTEFLFRGLRHNISNIKSLAKIDLTIVEEAEDVPEHSWLALEPTVLRESGAEMWVIWNPRDEGSPVDQRFRQSPPDKSVIVELHHQDNPWFPAGLDELRRREQQRLDPNTYAHIWDGAYLLNSDAQVLAGKWRTAEFEPGKDWKGPYHGLDFGFSQDPTTANRVWIHNESLYVEYEAHGVGMEIDDTARVLKSSIPGIENYEVLADNARPESISYLKRNGLPRCTAVKKWPGSVEDGITHLRGYREIVIHPRCVHTAKEARLYSYKIDSKSGQVLSQVVDAHNHHIDDIRYALQPVIRRREKKTTMKAIGGTY